MDAETAKFQLIAGSPLSCRPARGRLVWPGRAPPYLGPLKGMFGTTLPFPSTPASGRRSPIRDAPENIAGVRCVWDALHASTQFDELPRLKSRSQQVIVIPCSGVHQISHYNSAQPRHGDRLQRYLSPNLIGRLDDRLR
jgi:hypothetical protein